MRFEIVRFDKDYHQVVESVMMDFNNIHDAEKYCEGASGCGEEYYVKCTKQDNIKIIDELVRQTDVSSFMWRDKYGAYHVITSYSIHYTKLYDWVRGRSRSARCRRRSRCRAVAR